MKKVVYLMMLLTASILFVSCDAADTVSEILLPTGDDDMGEIISLQGLWDASNVSGYIAGTGNASTDLALTTAINSVGLSYPAALQFESEEATGVYTFYILNNEAEEGFDTHQGTYQFDESTAELTLTPDDTSVYPVEIWKVLIADASQLKIQRSIMNEWAELIAAVSQAYTQYVPNRATVTVYYTKYVE